MAANIQQLHTLQSIGVYKGGALFGIDLDAAIVTGVYVIDNGSSVVEQNYHAPNSKYATKITTPIGISYVTDETAFVDGLVINDCEICQLSDEPTSVVKISSSCVEPVFVKDCETADIIAELKKIYEAVDDIELTAESISIDAGEINLNTDEVEQLLTDIKELITNAAKYNNEEQHRVTGSAIDSDYAGDATLGSSYTFAANTYHSIAIFIEEGIGSITIDGKKHTHKAGYTKTFTASELLSNSIKIDAVSSDAVLTITTIK